MDTQLFYFQTRQIRYQLSLEIYYTPTTTLYYYYYLLLLLLETYKASYFVCSKHTKLLNETSCSTIKTNKYFSHTAVLVCKKINVNKALSRNQVRVFVCALNLRTGVSAINVVNRPFSTIALYNRTRSSCRLLTV